MARVGIGKGAIAEVGGGARGVMVGGTYTGGGTGGEGEGAGTEVGLRGVLSVTGGTGGTCREFVNQAAT